VTTAAADGDALRTVHGERVERSAPEWEGEPGRRAALAALLGATFVGTLNNSVANVAVTRVSEEFDLEVSTGVWFVSSFVLLIAVLMPLAGRLGDMFGVRRTFQLGLVGFSVGALVVALAPWYPLIVFGRCVQGAAGATVLPCIMVTIARMYPLRERGRAVGAWAAVNAAALAVGPLAGGAVVDVLGWRTLWWFDAPALALVGLAAHRFVPPDGPVVRDKLDLPGAALATASIVTLSIGLERATDWGLVDPRSLAVLVVVGVLSLRFVRRERRVAAPFLNLDLFRRPGYGALCISAGMQMVALFAMSFALPVYLITGRGLSEGVAGALLALLPGTMLLGAPMAGTLSDRWPIVRLLVAGSALLVVGALISMIRPSSVPFLVVAVVVTGLGISAIQSPATTGVLEVVREDERGVALGVFNTVRFVAGGLGATVAGVALQLASGLSPGDVPADAVGLADRGFRAAVCVGVVAGVVSLVSAVRLSRTEQLHRDVELPLDTLVHQDTVYRMVDGGSA
jgi:MFS family permease